jgi:glycine cleavage system H protein
MSASNFTAHAQPCLWMTAGVVTYKLCDRDFDCEHCPFDAALRGRVEVAPAGRRATGDLPPWTFPDDRAYTSGHLWLTGGGGSSPLRLGLDAFAAVLLGRARRVRGSPPGRALAAHETLCEIDLEAGLLRLAAPFAARVVRSNGALSSDPHLVITSPYEEGWLVEMEAAENPAAFSHLLTAESAREQACLDLRHFRRRVALHLLDDSTLGPTLPDGGVPLTDLRQILGGPRYLALLQELVH